MGGMKRRTGEIAKTLDAWIAELRVEENGWRTDAAVNGVVRGIEKGNACSLEEILGMPVRESVDDDVSRVFASRLASRLYPSGAVVIEEAELMLADTEVRFYVGLRLVYPE